MKGAIRKLGNSSGLLIPKPLLAEIGAKVGDEVDISVEGRRIVVAFPKPHPRAGWADASAIIGADERTEEHLDWLNVPNDGDADLKWCAAARSG